MTGHSQTKRRRRYFVLLHELRILVFLEGLSLGRGCSSWEQGEGATEGGASWGFCRLLLVSFSNATLTELRKPRTYRSVALMIFAFSLKSRGRGTLGWAFARKTEALSVGSTVLGKLPALRRATSSPL